MKYAGPVHQSLFQNVIHTFDLDERRARSRRYQAACVFDANLMVRRALNDELGTGILSLEATNSKGETGSCRACVKACEHP